MIPHFLHEEKGSAVIAHKIDALDNGRINTHQTAGLKL